MRGQFIDGRGIKVIFNFGFQRRLVALQREQKIGS